MTYDDLTPEQQAKARALARTQLLETYSQGDIPAEPTIAAAVEEAWRRADSMRTPWFFTEYLVELAGDLIQAQAEDLAKATTYLPRGTPVQWV
jgi:hypothetical protein